jgi:5-methylcytosine-specific restriction endonuclease McrA
LPAVFPNKFCEQCGKQLILTSKIHITRKRFCSRRCLGIWTIATRSPERNREIWDKMQRLHNTPEINALKVHRGSDHPQWIKDRSLLKGRAPNSPEVKAWRTAVFERDNYICQTCRRRGSRLQANHKKPWALFPELRFDVDNGETLCVECHKLTDSYGSKFMWKVKKGEVTRASYQ